MLSGKLIEGNTSGLPGCADCRHRQCTVTTAEKAFALVDPEAADMQSKPITRTLPPDGGAVSLLGRRRHTA